MGYNLSQFSKRLRQAREQAGLSQTDLASRCGYDDRRVIYSYECGRVSPNLELIEKLAKVLAVNAGWLSGL